MGESALAGGQAGRILDALLRAGAEVAAYAQPRLLLEALFLATFGGFSGPARGRLIGRGPLRGGLSAAPGPRRSASRAGRGADRLTARGRRA